MMNVSNSDYVFYSFPSATVCDIDDEKIKLFINNHESSYTKKLYPSKFMFLFTDNKVTKISIDDYKIAISQILDKYLINDISKNEPCKRLIIHINVSLDILFNFFYVYLIKN